MVHSLADKNDDPCALHFVEASASQVDDSEIEFTRVIVTGNDEDTDSVADEEEIIYCDVDDAGPVEQSDCQSETNQFPYIYLETEDYDSNGYPADIQSSDFEFSETFPIEAEVIRVTEIKYEEAAPSSECEPTDKHGDGISIIDVEEPNETFSCRVCDRSFGLERSLKRHMAVHLRRTNRTFPRKNRLLKRAKICRTERRFSCARCSQSFVFVGNLKKHIATTHQNEPVSSSTDASTVAVRPELSGRNTASDNEKAIICAVCHQEFSQKSILKRHMMIHTNEKPFSCTICERSFARKDYLKKHMMIHIKDKPFRCTICKEIFTWKKNLQNHLMHHYTKRPFSCSVCARSFVMKSHLKIHMLTHDDEKSYHCSTCSRSFTMKHHYATHMLIHTNGKSYLCSFCGRSFTQRHIMQIHTKVHTREEPTFTCATCNRTYMQKSDLKTHLLKTHKRVRCFSCPVCSRSFFLEKNLKSHMTTHGNNRIYYACTVCKRSFTRKNHLKRHVMIHSNKLDL